MNMDFDYWASKAREENPDFGLEERVEAVPEIIEETADKGFEEPLDMNMPISDDAVIKEPVASNDIPSTEDVILNEQSDETRKQPKAGRICKAIFLGVPFGIPIFILMLALLGALVAAVCVIFGIMVMSAFLLTVGGLSFVLLGISNVHVLFAPSLLLIGVGIFSISVGIFVGLLTRLVFKYVLLGLIKSFVLPVRFVKLFFCKKNTGEEYIPGEEENA